MFLGLTLWLRVSLNPFIRAPLWRVCFLLIYPIFTCFFSQTPLSTIFQSALLYLQVLFIRFKVITLLFGTSESNERVELRFGLDFVSPIFVTIHLFL
jgi:hypothetical protein